MGCWYSSEARPERQPRRMLLISAWEPRNTRTWRSPECLTRNMYHICGEAHRHVCPPSAAKERRGKSSNLDQPGADLTLLHTDSPNY